VTWYSSAAPYLLAWRYGSPEYNKQIRALRVPPGQANLGNGQPSSGLEGYS
jgi:hypothetical protein